MLKFEPKAETSALSKALPRRKNWIDVARGIGILFVVVGHTWRGLEKAGFINDPSLFNVVDRLIYNFHMPLFFFLSGFLFDVSSTKPVSVGLWSKAVRLLWPLAIWTWIFYGFKIAIGQAANAPLELADFPFIPLPPREHFWFLWALFLISAAALLLLPLARRTFGANSIWLPFAVVSIAIYLAMRPIGSIGLWFGSAVAYAPFFALGMYVACKEPFIKVTEQILFALAVFVAAEAAAVSVPASDITGPIISAVAVMSLLCVVMFAEQRWSESRWISILSVLGLSSMSIYVAHVMFSAGARAGLQYFGVTSLTIHLVIGTVLGVIGPLVLLYAARKYKAERILGL